MEYLNVSSLVKKKDYNTKISEIENKIIADQFHDKYITDQESNKFTSENIYCKTETSKFSKQK